MMKFRTLIIAAIAFCTSTGIIAQPKDLQKVGKAVFSLTTFTADGSILSTSHGVFTSKDGEAISLWKPFVGADSAIVVDASGKIHEVDAIMGANEIYDVCKFRVTGSTTPASLSARHLSEGEKAWQVGYALKKPETTALTVKKTEDFMGEYAFYLFNELVEDHTLGCPIVNQQGEVVALSQQAATTRDGQATDARFVNSFAITKGIDIGESAYQKTSIRLDMPKDQEEALNLIMLAGGRGDSKNYPKYVVDFRKLFPTAVEGYSLDAQTAVAQGRFADADVMMKEALEQADEKDKAHSEYARIIYNKILYSPDTLFTEWTLDKALEEAENAYSVKPEPSYRHLQAQIIYSQQKYDDAYAMFMNLTSTPIRNSEIFYEAAQCKAQLNARQDEIIALLDSAVEVCPKPISAMDAPYIYARGQAYDNAGQYRKAIVDYYQYDSLMAGRASADFYYTRYQCEMNMRQYQQALNDIAHAIYLNPAVPEYMLEMATLQLRVNQPENALKSCELAEKVNPDLSDIYIIRGLAHIQLKQKSEGLSALEKARQMGDERAEALIEKYK